MGVYFLQFYSRMLISKDMVVKGFFPAKNFQNYFFFLRKKNAFKNIYHTLEDFSKFDRPFKSTVYCMQLYQLQSGILKKAKCHSLSFQQPKYKLFQNAEKNISIFPQLDCRCRLYSQLGFYLPSGLHPVSINVSGHSQLPVNGLKARPRRKLTICPLHCFCILSLGY